MESLDGLWYDPRFGKDAIRRGLGWTWHNESCLERFGDGWFFSHGFLLFPSQCSGCLIFNASRYGVAREAFDTHWSFNKHAAALRWNRPVVARFYDIQTNIKSVQGEQAQQRIVLSESNLFFFNVFLAIQAIDSAFTTMHKTSTMVGLAMVGNVLEITGPFLLNLLPTRTLVTWTCFLYKFNSWPPGDIWLLYCFIGKPNFKPHHPINLLHRTKFPIDFP